MVRLERGSRAMDENHRWRVRRRGKVGDYVVGRMAGSCARALALRWVTASERAEIESLAASMSIDPRLGLHLAPRASFATTESDAHAAVVSWMQWVSELPEPQRTEMIAAFEFYLAFGGDAEFDAV